jgi:predicted aldo/keto reductase-like oxidoreductase
MSLPVSTVVVGMESLELLQQNLKIASTFKMIPEKEKSYLLEKTRPYGEDGKCEPHQTSISYDSWR